MRKTAPWKPVGTPSAGFLGAGLAGDATSLLESWMYPSVSCNTVSTQDSLAVASKDPPLKESMRIDSVGPKRCFPASLSSSPDHVPFILKLGEGFGQEVPALSYGGPRT